jgi:hypothetical protein
MEIIERRRIQSMKLRVFEKAVICKPPLKIPLAETFVVTKIYTTPYRKATPFNTSSLPYFLVVPRLAVKSIPS